MSEGAAAFKCLAALLSCWVGCAESALFISGWIFWARERHLDGHCEQSCSTFALSYLITYILFACCCASPFLAMTGTSEDPAITQLFVMLFRIPFMIYGWIVFAGSSCIGAINHHTHLYHWVMAVDITYTIVIGLPLAILFIVFTIGILVAGCQAGLSWTAVHTSYHQTKTLAKSVSGKFSKPDGAADYENVEVNQQEAQEEGCSSTVIPVNCNSDAVAGNAESEGVVTETAIEVLAADSRDGVNLNSADVPAEKVHHVDETVSVASPPPSTAEALTNSAPTLSSEEAAGNNI